MNLRDAVAGIINHLRPGRASLSDHYAYLVPAPENKKIAEKRSHGLYVVKSTAVDRPGYKEGMEIQDAYRDGKINRSVVRCVYFDSVTLVFSADLHIRKMGVQAKTLSYLISQINSLAKEKNDER